MKKFKTKEEAQQYFNQVIKPIAHALHLPPHRFVRIKGVAIIAPFQAFDKFRISDYEMSTEVRAGQVIFPMADVAPMTSWLHRRHVNASVTEMDPWDSLTKNIEQPKKEQPKHNEKVTTFDTLDHCIRNGRRMGLSFVLRENLELTNKLERLSKENSANKEQLETLKKVIEDMTASGGNLGDVVHLTRQLGIFDKGQEATLKEKKPVRDLSVIEVKTRRGSGIVSEYCHAEAGKYVILSTEDARRMYRRVVFKDDARILADAIDASTCHA